MLSCCVKDRPEECVDGAPMVPCWSTDPPDAARGCCGCEDLCISVDLSGDDSDSGGTGGTPPKGGPETFEVPPLRHPLIVGWKSEDPEDDEPDLYGPESQSDDAPQGRA